MITQTSFHLSTETSPSVLQTETHSNGPARKAQRVSRHLKISSVTMLTEFSTDWPLATE